MKQTIIEGWYGEYFARQKRLKPLNNYLSDRSKKTLLKKGETMKAGPWLALMGVKTQPHPEPDE